MKEQQFESSTSGLRKVWGAVSMQLRGSYPSPRQPLSYRGPADSHAHPGQAARQGAGQVPNVHSEAKRWVPSSWQRERQLAQEGKSQGADCWGRMLRRCVQDTVLGCPPELSG